MSDRKCSCFYSFAVTKHFDTPDIVGKPLVLQSVYFTTNYALGVLSVHSQLYNVLYNDMHNVLYNVKNCTLNITVPAYLASVSKVLVLEMDLSDIFVVWNYAQTGYITFDMR